MSVVLLALISAALFGVSTPAAKVLLGTVDQPSQGLPVQALGTAPLSYQWRFSGTPIGSCTSSSCTVAGATLASAGSYDAVVSNPYGTTTSAVAQLTVLVPPSINSQPTNQTVMAGSGAEKTTWPHIDAWLSKRAD